MCFLLEFVFAVVGSLRHHNCFINWKLVSLKFVFLVAGFLKHHSCFLKPKNICCEICVCWWDFSNIVVVLFLYVVESYRMNMGPISLSAFSKNNILDYA